MAATLLAPLSPPASSPSPASSVGAASRPSRRFPLSRLGLVLIASSVILSACAAGPERPPYPGRRVGGGAGDTTMGDAAKEMRSTQSVLSSGNSILSTVGAIGRNVSRLGR